MMVNSRTISHRPRDARKRETPAVEPVFDLKRKAPVPARKKRGAEVRDPPGEEERGIGVGDVFRGEGGVAQVIAGVVDCHDDHDESAEYVDGGDARGYWA